MDHGKFNFLESDGSIFAGAIFMSNRETKLECLHRNLFGLPLSKSKFLKQVKAGMILFLFEYEERKLYGVFEATSDGALNIIPDAFRSTGQSYPAQILFKRIWVCKPLREDEFHNAIKKNYYSSNKFHFGLNYEQVVKLIHLFHSRKINMNQYKGHEIPNKIIEKFENPSADEVRLTEKETHFKYKSNEPEAQPNQVFEFPDYIPLVEETQQMLVNRENQNSSSENSEYIPSTIHNSCIPNTCKEFSKYLNSADGYSNDDDDKLKTYQREETDEYNAVSSKFYADFDSRRTSVFSRLSQHEKICNDETPEPSSSEPSRGLSLEEFLNILSTRRSYWSSKEISKQLVEWDSNEQYESAALTGLFDHSNRHNKITQLPIEPVERSGIDQYKGIADTQHVGFTASFDGNLSNDVLDEESFEIPFYNFRRRNMSQEHEVPDDCNKNDDISGSEAKLMRNKRRRIVRPSLYEGMEQNVKIEAEAKKYAQKKVETEVEISAQASLDSKNESEVSVVDRFLDSVVLLRTLRKYEPVGESFEQTHVTSMEESLDYIPIE